MQEGSERVRQLVAEIVPADDMERSHRAGVLAWLGGTEDICRWAKPATQPKHLVSYAVLVDSSDLSVFLVDHILAALWLPTGGHVQPGEDPTATAGRETGGGPQERSARPARRYSTRISAASSASCSQ
jgi:8-oxo-dGTP diphosphatase